VLPMRDLVFVSHANPEDNHFSLWLTLRLAREGYVVWLDLNRLLGGENFWGDIEEIIRHRACKVLYVLSRRSNAKPGPLKELAVAQTVAKKEGFRDFVIPLHIDDIPHSDININLHQLNAISFDQSWQTGFHQLLLKLEKDRLKKDARFTPDAVTAWWRTQFGAEAGVVAEPEDCVSNWFEITKLPEKLYFHEGTRKDQSDSNENCDPPFPSIESGQRWVSFADAGHFGHKFDVTRSKAFATEDVIEGIVDERYIYKSEARKIISFLLVDNWVRMTHVRKMAVYQLSNHRFCGALRQNQVKDDKIFYTGIDGKPAWRGIIGYKTMKRLNAPNWVRFWHFAVQAKVKFLPTLVFVVSQHVVFSEDGQNLWESRERQHSARRSQCKNWWNDDWRDRLIAMMCWFAEGLDRITIDCGGDSIEVGSRPLTFASPVTYHGEVPSVLTDGDAREAAGTENAGDGGDGDEIDDADEGES
jgi:hypothetical protein